MTARRPVRKISVVVPTHDRPELLRRGLEALARQGLPASRFEVLVVDDGSVAPPEEAVESVAPRLPVRLLVKPNGGLASARNHGAARASGDLLLFLDDDIVPCPGFLEAHLAVHERDDRAVALGSLPHPDDLAMTPFLYYLDRIRHYDLFLRYGSADRIPLPPLNGNSSVLREHFEAAGGYDLGFSGYGGEDTEMGYRLLRRGLRFVYAPDARGLHYHVKDFAAYKRDMFASGVTMVAIVRKYPEVRSRVNLDLVDGRLRELSPAKACKRLLYLALERFPGVVEALDRALAAAEPRGWRRLLYPAYRLVAHYHYGRGMRMELLRDG